MQLRKNSPQTPSPPPTFISLMTKFIIIMHVEFGYKRM